MNEIEIKYVDTVEGFNESFYAGQPVALKAEFVDSDIDEKDYWYCWLIDKGEFEAESREVEISNRRFLLSVSPVPRTRLLTNQVIEEQIHVTVVGFSKRAVDAIKRKSVG